MSDPPVTYDETSPVEMFGLGTGPSLWRIDSLYNSESGEYTVPEPAPGVRDFLLQMYLRDPGASVEKFNAAWPQIWKLTETVYRDNDQLLAILDTGVLQKHPLLAGCIRETVDLTGEGVEDRVGHGTLATLIARMMMTGVPRNKFVIVKCITAAGHGAQDTLIAGLRWLQDYNATHAVKIGVASLSLGAYNHRFGLLPCDGRCRLCATAVEVARDIRLHIASGNTAGVTACPARAAFLPNQTNIVAEGTSDEATSGVSTHSTSPWQGEAPRVMRLVPDGNSHASS